MLILSAPRAASALGSSCKSPSGADEPGLLELLRILSSRAEQALEVESLLYGVYTDTFTSPSIEDSWLGLRLSNGFVDKTQPIVFNNLYDTDGNAYAGTPQVSAELGIIRARGIRQNPDLDTTGYFTVTYTSGFKVPDYDPNLDAYTNPVAEDVNYRVYDGIPDAMSLIVVNCLVNRMRNMLMAPKGLPKTVNTLISMNAVLAKEISSSIYGYYARPRVGLLFPEDCSRA